MIVIVDEPKLVKTLGKRPIPLEIIPFGVESIKKQIEEMGYQGTWRKNHEGSFYITDNHNRIFDITLSSPLNQPEEMDEKLKAIPGVVETGFFFNLAKQVVVGKEDGSVDVK